MPKISAAELTSGNKAETLYQMIESAGLLASATGQAGEHEFAHAGRLAAAIGRDRGEVERPGDHLNIH